MTDQEKKRLLQIIFTEIRADHVDGRLTLEVKVRAALGALRGSRTGAPPVGAVGGRFCRYT